MAKQVKKKGIRANRERHMVVTPVGRVSFPQLFVPRSFQDDPSGQKIFRIDLIFDSVEELKQPYKGKKAQTPSLMQAILFAKQDMWGTDKTKWPDFRFANVRKGDEKKNSDGEMYEGYEGKVFIQAKAGEKFPPKVVAKNGKPLTENDVYGGCYGRAQIICSPYAQGVNYGVSLQLVAFLKEKDGEHFGIGGGDVFDFDEDDDSESDDGDWTDEDDL